MIGQVTERERRKTFIFTFIKYLNYLFYICIFFFKRLSFRNDDYHFMIIFQMNDLIIIELLTLHMYVVIRLEDNFEIHKNIDLISSFLKFS